MRFLTCLLSLLIVSGTPAQTSRTSGSAKDSGAVDVIKNLDYHGGEGTHARHRLDLYLPAAPKPAPLLVFIHGGAWRMGDKRWFRRAAQAFAGAGIATATINYRLRDVQHPAQIEDCARAFAWLVKHAAKYGFDRKRVFVSGHSAGGHLAALLALNTRFLAKHQLGRANIRGVIPISGVYDVRLGLRIFKSVFGDDKKNRSDGSPFVHIGGAMPPFLVLWAENEMNGLGLQANAFVRRLEKEKASVRKSKIADRSHNTIARRLGTKGDVTTRLLLDFIAQPTPAPTAKKEPAGSSSSRQGQ